MRFSRERRERQVERVEAQVAAVGHDVLVLERLDVRGLEVEGLASEVEADRLAGRVVDVSRLSASPLRMLVKNDALKPWFE